MIPVAPAPEPDDFDKKVRQPGLRALAEMVGKTPPFPRRNGKRFAQRKRKAADGSTRLVTREQDLPPDEFPPYWTRALDEFTHAYKRICAYSCFRIHEVTGSHTVDHFAPKSRAWNHVYEWDNYRLACSRLNARKNDFVDVLDPFKIGAGWFELELTGFQILPGAGLDATQRKRVTDTINRLRLNDATFKRRREDDAESYWDKQFTFEHLKRESPFVAQELKRQEHLFEHEPLHTTLTRVYKAIAQNNGCSRAQVLALTGLDPNSWKKSIGVLLERGVVFKRGRGAATRYGAH